MEIDDNQLDTYSDSLTPNEKERAGLLRHPEKRLEFLASRHLRTELFGLQQIYYSPVGSPFIEHEGFISLSHTKGLVALAHSPLFNVGLDVESVRAKAVLLHTRFMHPTEHVFFDAASAHDMSLLWSFKETLFKLADRKGVHFASDLIIRKEQDDYHGTIHHHGRYEEYPLHSEPYRDYLITCNTERPKIILH